MTTTHTKGMSQKEKETGTHTQGHPKEPTAKNAIWPAMRISDKQPRIVDKWVKRLLKRSKVSQRSIRNRNTRKNAPTEKEDSTPTVKGQAARKQGHRKNRKSTKQALAIAMNLWVSSTIATATEVEQQPQEGAYNMFDKLARHMTNDGQANPTPLDNNQMSNHLQSESANEPAALQERP